MMQFHKLPNLEDLKLLYYDLRDRLKEKYTKPVGGIPASDLAEDVIPDISSKADVSVTDHLQRNKAPVIIESATGNPIVITDGADGLPLSKCKLTLLPKQDLHGQTAPYPPGGGKNKYPIAIGEDILINNGNATHSNDNGALVIVTDASGGSSGIYLNSNSEFRKLLDKYNAPLTVSMDIVATASGNVRIVFCGQQQLFEVGTTKQRISVSTTTLDTKNFNIYGVNNGATITISNLQIESGSTASDYVPYSNICPIEPWENVGMWHTGANVWDEEVELGGINSSTGIEYSSTTAIRAKNYIPVVPGASYYMKSPTSSCTGCWYDKNKNYISTRYITNQVMTAPSNAYFFRFDLPSSYGTTYNHDISINYPSTDTEYHPYTGQSHPIDLSSITPAIYGCEINPITGEVWGTWASFSAKWKDWVTTGTVGGTIERKSFSMPVTFVNAARAASAYCNVAKWKWNYEEALIHFYSHASTSYVFLPIDTDGETDIHIVGKLATPVLLATLSPQEIRTLLGTNTIWSDANSIDIEYRADTGLFLKQNTVKDVRLNGTSILENLIANIPLMSWDKLGVAKVSNNYGLTMGSTGGQFLQIDGASQSTVKAGANSFAPITSSHQHEAAFYGLAKVAGADMASSSNPIGTYTDEAKIAIQKMLGIYEPPFELIYDETLSEESGFDITTDLNGVPLNLLSVFITVDYPADAPSVSTGFGRYDFIDNDGHALTAETVRYSTSVYQTYKYLYLESRANLKLLHFTQKATTGDSAIWRIKRWLSGADTRVGNIVRIRTNPSDHEPTGTKIKIYAQKAY